MKLLTFAHKPEAAAFFDSFSMKSTPKEGLYQSDFGWILITGEGIQESIARVALVLGSCPEIKEVINLGVAGALQNQLRVGQVVEVAGSYAFDEKALFKSFTLSGKVNCVTSGKRILDDSQLSPLLAMGDLVDRELWGVCYAAKEARVPVRSFKYISDKAGSLTACEVVKDLAQHASESLLNIFKGLSPVLEKKKLDLAGFYLTFSQEQQIESLVAKLSIKWEIEASEVLGKIGVSQLRLEKIQSKDRSKKLIEKLRESLDPWGSDFEKKQRERFKQWDSLSISSPTHFQTPELKAVLSFQSLEELEEKTQTLRKIDWLDFFEQFKVKDV